MSPLITVHKFKDFNYISNCISEILIHVGHIEHKH